MEIKINSEKSILNKIKEIENTAKSSIEILSQLERVFNLNVCAQLSISTEDKRIEFIKFFKKTGEKNDSTVKQKILNLHDKNIEELLENVNELVLEYYSKTNDYPLKRYFLYQSGTRLEILIVDDPGSSLITFDYIVKIIELHVQKEINNEMWAEKNQSLQRAMQITNQLTLEILDGKNLYSICDSLSKHILYPISLVDNFLHERFSSEDFTAHNTFFDSNYVYEAYFHHAELTINNNIGIYPIKLKHEIMGFLLIQLDDAVLSSSLQIIIEQGLNMIALQFIKEKELINAKRQFIDGFIREYTSTKEKKEFLKKVQLADGYQNIPCYHISFVNMTDSEIERALNIIYIESRSLTYMPLLAKTGIIFFSVIGKNELETFINKIKTTLKKQRTNLAVNIGRKVDTILNIDVSYTDTENMKRYSLFSYKKVVFFDDLLVENLFLDVPLEKISDFVFQILGPILQNTNRYQILFLTLNTLIDCNKNHKLTCERLAIHPNTLYYRLQVIQEELDIDFSNTNDWFRTHLAIQLQKLFGLSKKN